MNYLNVGRHVIYHDLRTRSNRQGLTSSVEHPNEAYYLLSNSVLQIRESTSIPVKAGDIVGLSLLPDRNPWEDAIPVISFDGSSSSYVLTEEPDTTCWNADAEGFIPCHTVTGFAQPVMAVEFQEGMQGSANTSGSFGDSLSVPFMCVGGYGHYVLSCTCTATVIRLNVMYSIA